MGPHARASRRAVGVGGEPGHAADEPEEFCRRMGRVLAHELLKLMAMDPEERYAARLVRLRHLGE